MALFWFSVLQVSRNTSCVKCINKFLVLSVIFISTTEIDAKMAKDCQLRFTNTIRYSLSITMLKSHSLQPHSLQAVYKLRPTQCGAR